MRWQKNMFQKKEQDKTHEKELGEMEISNLLDKTFKIIIIKMLNELRRQNKKNKIGFFFNKGLENINKNQKELKK